MPLTVAKKGMVVAGVDGCRGGWIAFKVELPSRTSSIELIDLPSWLRARPADLSRVGIDIPIGLMDRPRACDGAARKLLGWPRRNSVFSPPCRSALLATNYAGCCATNLNATGKKISQQAWGIVPKIGAVDNAITPDCQSWAFEVHPEVSFWALAGQRPMRHVKKTASGANERLTLLRNIFPEIDRHMVSRPSGVGKDDLLDAAVAAWTALRLANCEALQVCEPERDSRGLSVTIWY